MSGIRVLIWNEGVHERTNEKVRAVYPNGIGRQIAAGLKDHPGIASVRCAELADDENGLTEAALAETDVLLWWGHLAHDQVPDAKVDLVQRRIVQEGMGAIFLHSGHYSKPFKRLMGTTCALKWREWKEVGEKERLWVVDPAHPIAEGLNEYFEIPHAEMYGEHFDIPAPESLVFISWFQGGEVFRSGCCWHRGLGKVFYFRPGHETFPIYYQPEVMHVIANAIRWAAPSRLRANPIRACREPLESMPG
jgi:trehalose utilization protein